MTTSVPATRPAGSGSATCPLASATTDQGSAGSLVLGRGAAQRTIAVGAEFGELAGDVDGVGAVEVDVLVVGRPDVGQDGVVDVAAGAAQRGDGQAVVLGGPGHHRVGREGQAPHLLGLLLVARAADRAFPGVGEHPLEGVDVLALVELPADPAPVGFVHEVAGGYVDGAAQRAVLLDRGGEGVLLP